MFNPLETLNNKKLIHPSIKKNYYLESTKYKITSEREVKEKQKRDKIRREWENFLKMWDFDIVLTNTVKTGTRNINTGYELIRKYFNWINKQYRKNYFCAFTLGVYSENSKLKLHFHSLLKSSPNYPESFHKYLQDDPDKLKESFEKGWKNFGTVDFRKHNDKDDFIEKYFSKEKNLRLTTNNKRRDRWNFYTYNEKLLMRYKKKEINI